ncbi:unnamed protein product [Symbiodinium necroappetens]|uniref:Uncharacterized protein n=1 Tax=Symbiodinium necroappetens TaxID=1628268 RepID=A0A813CI75_9DINO|nr:unnamed protein product [Symbiodinium necroappetens]
MGAPTPPLKIFILMSETIGSAVANVAVVVGNRVVEPPKLKWNDLDDFGGSLRNLKQFAEGIENDAMSVGEITLDATREVAEIAVTQAVRLAKTTLEHAKKTAEQGAKIAEAVGRFIADQARAFGEEVAKVGPLVSGLGQELWSEMMSFLNCLKPSTSLCQVLIGRECDCSAGSYVKVFTDRMEMRCVFSRTSEFSQGFGIKAMQDSDPKSGTTLLPGSEFTQPYKMYKDVLRSRDGLQETWVSENKNPCGLCVSEHRTEREVWVVASTLTPFVPNLKPYTVCSITRDSFKTLTILSEGNAETKARGPVRN